jgi:putative ABC transport system permease protein
MFALQALQATKLRSLALAATGAVAIFGSIAVEAAHRNLLHGLYEDYAQYVSSADIWIAHPDDDLAFQPFEDHGFSQKIRSVPGVATVRPYFGGLLDLSGRRAWILARPSSDRPMISPSQIIDGDPQPATARLSAGGWATLSKHIADKRQLHVGDAFSLPTPTGTIRLHLAATTTNLGWGPGAIILNSRDYCRAWASESPTAFEVQVKPGTDPIATRRAIQDALGPNSALLAQTTAERASHANALARAGLARLSQISTLLLIAAALAMAAAIGTTIWQRRPALAQLQVQGGDPPQLWRSLLLETGLVLFVGCFTGALTGTYGHFLLDRWLQLTTGYPAPFAAASAQTLLTCLKVAAAAALTATAVGYLAANAPTRLALNTDN